MDNVFTDHGFKNHQNIFSKKRGNFFFQKMGEFFLSSFRQGLAGVAFVSLAPIIPNGISNVRRILFGDFSIQFDSGIQRPKMAFPRREECRQISKRGTIQCGNAHFFGGRQNTFSFTGGQIGVNWGLQVQHIRLHGGSNWGELRFAGPSQARA